MKLNIAIIDVGSNNIKLEIHQIKDHGYWELLYSDKVNARLGEEAFLTHKLSTKSIQKAILGIKQFAKIIKNFDCKETIAVGTAALREASHESFIENVYEVSGIKIKIISGIEEAQFVYLGALGHVPFEYKTFFLVDIGGGSTEISISDKKNIYFIDSFAIGTVRLKELFGIKGDMTKMKTRQYISNEALSLMKNYVGQALSTLTDHTKKYSIDMGLFTGGTARALLEILKNYSDKKVKEKNGIPILNTETLELFIKKISKMSLNQLKKLKGLDKDRVDIIIPGAILMLKALKIAKIKNSYIISQGLRDGVLTDYVYRKINKKIYLEKQELYKEQGLKKISKKFNQANHHAEQCVKLSLELFGILKKEHGLDNKYKNILYGAALLHDIGNYISYSAHHKHSEYLILNSDLLGFSKEEKLWMALIARYHRKGFPKSLKKNYQDLKKEHKNMILKLAAILRIADGLDRSYKNAVTKIERSISEPNCIQLLLHSNKDISLELWSVERKKNFFEHVYGKTLHVRKA